MRSPLSIPIFFFNDTATTEIYTLSLHDALPISDLVALQWEVDDEPPMFTIGIGPWVSVGWNASGLSRSEEHTSELQSRPHLVCRLLLEKKKMKAIQMVLSFPSSSCLTCFLPHP